MEEANVVPVAADIRREWHWVRPAIEELLNDNPDVDAIPEDVYAACKAGIANLWVIPTGMFITRFEYGDLNNEKTLDLWFAWTKEKGGRAAPDVLARASARVAGAEAAALVHAVVGVESVGDVHPLRYIKPASVVGGACIAPTKRGGC